MLIRTRLEEVLSSRADEGLMRQRKVRHSPVAPEVTVNNKSFLNFASNDYLGLANHPFVVKAFKEATDRYGVGGGAAQIVSGYTAAHQMLEEALADFLGYPRVLVFSTGYMANIGVLTALSPHLDIILQDKLNHASLADGAMFAKIHFERYLHRSTEDLCRRLQKHPSKNCLIASDGVFSVQGDLANLPELSQQAKKTDALLMIDDAHGLGALGTNGRGSLEHFDLPSSAVDILVGTFGKSFGTFGAFVAADNVIIETLLQFARSYIYTTALPPSVVAATYTSLQLMQTENWRRDHLQELIAYFQEGVSKLNLPYTQSITSIQCISIGSPHEALQMGEALANEGILVAVMRPPTTPPNQSCLRVTLTASHQKSHVDQLLLAIERIIMQRKSRI